MDIFHKTGIKNCYIPRGEGAFYIEKNDQSDDYYYSGDSINYELDAALVNLYDTFRDLYFDDIDQYYEESYTLPIFSISAGYDSDCATSVNRFNQWIEDSAFYNLPNFYKHLYLQDCQAMISTIQNHLSGMEYYFTSFYTMLPYVNTMMNHQLTENGVIFCCSGKTRVISSLLESYFTKAYSILDMICKILFEFQKPEEDFTKYKKLKSANKLWGDKNKLSLAGFSDSVFDKCDTLSMIEALRNEVVHNGSWEQNPKVFLKIENGQEVERFMLFPDISQGRLAASKNRKHFFSMETKVNDILPTIHSDFKERLLRTVEQINIMYP